MENASKALLIAGSILIVILLIGVGMMIFNSIGSVTSAGQDSMDKTAIQAFNQDFLAYEGSNKTAAEIKSLWRMIQANNINSDNQVKFNGTLLASSSVIPTTYSNAVRYTISFELNELGYVSNAVVKTATGTVVPAVNGGGAGGAGGNVLD